MTMNYYTKPNGEVHALAEDGSQDQFLTEDMRLMTEAELAAHFATPPPQVPIYVEMIQARLALLHAGHLATVKAAIAAMPGIEGEEARETWEFAPRVRRDSSLVAAMGVLLSLTDKQLDDLFLDAATR